MLLFLRSYGSFYQLQRRHADVRRVSDGQGAVEQRTVAMRGLHARFLSRFDGCHRVPSLSRRPRHERKRVRAVRPVRSRLVRCDARLAIVPSLWQWNLRRRNRYDQLHPLLGRSIREPHGTHHALLPMRCGILRTIGRTGCVPLLPERNGHDPHCTEPVRQLRARTLR